MIYIFIFVLLLLIEFLYIKLAVKFKIVDKPNSRSSHNNVTILGGGIIFFISILIYCIIYGFQYPWFFVSLTLLTSVSFIDDLKPQSFRLRLLVQIIAILLMFHELGVLDLQWYFIVPAIIIAPGILNAYNFMDGINGMISLTSLVVLTSLLYIDHFIIDFADVNMIVFSLLSLIVFAFFNVRNKAKCFAGDVGAISMAFIVLFLLTKLILKTENFIWLGLLSVFGVEVVLTMIHRIILKENLSVAHRKHLFQLMVNELKMPHLKVSAIYAIIQLIISIGLIAFNGAFAIAFFVIEIIVLSVIYYSFIKKYFQLHISK
ncbi:glycosyltransferase family 4 protein [Paludibacter sp.]